MLLDLYCSTITMDFSQLNRGYLMTICSIQNDVGPLGKFLGNKPKGRFYFLKDQRVCRGPRGFERVGF